MCTAGVREYTAGVIYAVGVVELRGQALDVHCWG